MSEKQAALLIHGLTGSPQNLQPIRASLEKSGFKVAAPMLAGHGIDAATLAKTPWSCWYKTVKCAYQKLLDKGYTSIHCCGTSMGGLLGIKLAMEASVNLKSLCLIGTPLLLKGINQKIYIPLFRYTPLRWLIPFIKKNYVNSVADPRGRALYKKYSLGLMPVKSIFQFEDLRRESVLGLEKIKTPILALHGMGDQIASPKSIDLLTEHIKISELETEIFPRSRHVLPLDYDRSDVAARIAKFCRDHS